MISKEVSLQEIINMNLQAKILLESLSSEAEKNRKAVDEIIEKEPSNFNKIYVEGYKHLSIYECALGASTYAEKALEAAVALHNISAYKIKKSAIRKVEVYFYRVLTESVYTAKYYLSYFGNKK